LSLLFGPVSDDEIPEDVDGQVVEDHLSLDGLAPDEGATDGDAPSVLTPVSRDPDSGEYTTVVRGDDVQGEATDFTLLLALDNHIEAIEGEFGHDQHLDDGRGNLTLVHLVLAAG
jgi:hypothetical protein